VRVTNGKEDLCRLRQPTLTLTLSQSWEREKRPFAWELGVFSWFRVPQRGMKNCGEKFFEI
jgi:hypothetical protein